MAIPFDYSLCRRTVTVYGQRQGKVERRELKCLCVQKESFTKFHEYGDRLIRSVSLVIPGAPDIRVGDRLYDGIGPVDPQWDTFLPGTVDHLLRVSMVHPCYWGAVICHVQLRAE